MKNYIALTSVVLLALIHFENQLHIVPRYYAGTIQKDVELSQGEIGMLKQIESAVPEQKALLLNSFKNKVRKNMDAIRRHVNCYENPAECGSSR